MTTDHMSVAARIQVDQPWREHAACKGMAAVMDPPAEMVKAARAFGIDDRLWLEAKRVCWACPVMADCRAWALSIGGDHDWFGVCGGLTEAERQSARRRAGNLTANRTGPAAAGGSWAAARAARSRDADERYVRYVELWREDLAVDQIAGRLGVSATSVRRYEQRRRREERT